LTPNNRISGKIGEQFKNLKMEGKEIGQHAKFG
jgi:hypothetical protein